MIYDEVLSCADEVQSAWTAIGERLAKLSSGLQADASATGQTDLVTGWIDTSTARTEDAATERQTMVELRSDVTGLLAAVAELLDDNLDALRPIREGLAVMAAFLGSADRGTATAASAAQREVEGAIARFERRQATFGQLGSEEAAQDSLEGIRSSVDNVSTYPILTQDASFPSGPVSPSGGSSGGGSLGGLVQNALKDALGWRPQSAASWRAGAATDAASYRAKGFVSALMQSFTCEEVDGTNRCRWTPRSYVVQADIGAVTGAQASIYTRAKVTLDQSLPLLDGLSPLRSDSDDEDVGATRAVARSQLQELVAELGQEGGPRVQRVDAVFESLLALGPDEQLDDPARVGGLLGEIRHEFGFNEGEVTTIGEEQNLTNFLILVDYVTSLKSSWDSRRAFFDRVGDEVFLGTQLVLLNRALAVTAESVHEVHRAMDSVFLGDAERQTTELTFRTTNGRAEAPMYVGELLSWVEQFASEIAPRLLQDGGKTGVRGLFPSIERIQDLVRRARLTTFGGDQDPAQFPGGYATARVQRALGELAEQLEKAIGLCNPLRDGNRRSGRRARSVTATD